VILVLLVHGGTEETEKGRREYKITNGVDWDVNHRDGNEDPIPNFPWGISLLEDGDGKFLSPRGCKWENFLPQRINGDGMGKHSPSPFPVRTR
jgi:hypothetical protein